MPVAKLRGTVFFAVVAAAVVLVDRSPADPADLPDRPVELRGTVLGPDGKPVPGAPVYLIRGDVARQQEYGVGRHLPAPRPRAVAGPDGQFRFRLTAQEQAEAGQSDSTTRLLAADPALARGPAPVPPGGYGVGWEMAWAFDPTDALRKAVGLAAAEGARAKPVLRLVKDDAPVTGRVLDKAGKPLRGVSVGVIGIYRATGEDLTAFVRALERDKLDYDDARQRHTDHMIGSDHRRQEELAGLLRAESDADGRFTLRGVGRERLPWLYLEGPAVRTAALWVRTRPGPAISLEHVHQSPGDVFTLYGSAFEYRAEPSVPLEGVVLDRDTDLPVPGVLVQTLTTGGISTAVHPAQDVTNNSGRFRLTGLPAANAALVAVPLDRPYLPAVQAAAVPAKGEARPVELRLKRGVWVRGRVTDTCTGRPLSAGVKYFAAADNPSLAGLDGYAGAAALPWPPNPPAYRTDADGWYTVPGLPGKGVVAAAVTGSYDRYMLGVGAGGVPGANGKGWMAWFQTRPEPCTASQFHALAAVDVPAGGKDADAPDLRPDTGETLTGTVLGPDGRPLAGATLFGGTQTGLVHNPTPHPTAEFRVRHYDPDWPRLLLFAHPEKNLAGSLLVRGKQPGKLSVQLQPAGTVTGTVVDAAGKPLAGVAVRAAWPVTTPEELTAGAVDFPKAYYRTDKDGRFRIDGLAPGVKYYRLVLAAPGSIGEPLASDIVVKSGETKDLGKLAAKRD